MTNDQLQAIIQNAFPDAQIAVQGGSGKFEVHIVSDLFEGKRSVQRQQLVYQPMNQVIASGEVHAVTIKAQTPEEYRKASLFG